jgi:hypothetical protein
VATETPDISTTFTRTVTASASQTIVPSETQTAAAAETETPSCTFTSTLSGTPVNTGTATHTHTETPENSPTQTPVVPTPTLTSVPGYAGGEIIIFPQPFDRSRAVNGELKFRNMPAPCTVYIYSSTGMLLAEMSSGNGKLNWDAKTASGNYLSPGFYVCVIKHSQGLINKNIIVIQSQSGRNDETIIGNAVADVSAVNM